MVSIEENKVIKLMIALLLNIKNEEVKDEYLIGSG